MFFRRKEDDERAEIRDIKQAMEEHDEEFPTIKPIMRPNYPAFNPEFAPEPPKPVYDRVAMPRAERETSAPLFVKVDKYREVLTTIHEIKLFVSSTKQLFSVLHEVETLRADAINVMRATLQRIEKSITEIDAELLRPKGISLSDMNIATTEIKHLGDSLDEMQKQLYDLRQQMQGLK